MTILRVVEYAAGHAVALELPSSIRLLKLLNLSHDSIELLVDFDEDVDDIRPISDPKYINAILKQAKEF